jgi:hypothetical protein
MEEEDTPSDDESNFDADSYKIDESRIVGVPRMIAKGQPKRAAHRPNPDEARVRNHCDM